MAAAAAANAADSTPTATTSSTAAADTPAAGGAVEESKSVRSDEHLLTGTDATSAGVYEAHLITVAGERLIVQMDATFTVTGNDIGGPSDGTRDADPTDAPSATTAG